MTSSLWEPKTDFIICRSLAISIILKHLILFRQLYTTKRTVIHHGNSILQFKPNSQAHDTSVDARIKIKVSRGVLHFRRWPIFRM